MNAHRNVICFNNAAYIFDEAISDDMVERIGNFIRESEDGASNIMSRTDLHVYDLPKGQVDYYDYTCSSGLVYLISPGDYKMEKGECGVTLYCSEGSRKKNSYILRTFDNMEEALSKYTTALLEDTMGVLNLSMRYMPPRN